MAFFYTSIADYYDYIFPLNKFQVDFILSEITKPYNNKSILEAGCGTGNLPLVLSEYGINVTGIDFDSEMINKAIKKCKTKTNLIVRYLDMRNLLTTFQNTYYNAIVCFGNTLVHLTDPSDIFSFIKQTKSLLAKNGTLLMQIINYDRILDQSIDSLPTIENKDIRFQRIYNLDSTSGLIEFKTILDVKSSNEVINNKVLLYPLRKKELTTYLTKAGYKEINYYSNFKKSASDSNSTPLIVSAKF